MPRNKARWKLPGQVTMAEFENRCQICGVTAEMAIANDKRSRISIDHVFSRKEGGSHSQINLGVLCLGCNGCKGSRTRDDRLPIVIGEYLRQMEERAKRFRRIWNENDRRCTFCRKLLAKPVVRGNPCLKKQPYFWLGVTLTCHYCVHDLSRNYSPDPNNAAKDCAADCSGCWQTDRGVAPRERQSAAQQWKRRKGFRKAKRFRWFNSFAQKLP